MDLVPDIALDRELGLRGGLLDFIRMAWHIVEPESQFLENWHVGAVCEHLEAVSSGQIKELVINQPPGTMKSLTTCVFWQPWVWLRDPGSRWLFGSFDQGLTFRDSGKALQIMQSPWFRERWGDRFLLPKTPAQGDFYNSRMGNRFATSVKGKGLGRHYHYHVIDDPIKPSEVNADSLAKAKTWRRETLSGRWVRLGERKSVLIMQRLHEDDLAADCIAEGHVLLKIPMRYEPKAFVTTCIGFADPRKEEGELLWEAKFPREAVDSQEKKLGPMATAAQNQQRPTPAGGLVYQRDWLRYHAPAGHGLPGLSERADGGVPRVTPVRFDKIVMSWDMKFKGVESADYVSGQAWGKVGPDFYLLDRVSDRWGFYDTLEQVRAFCRKHPKIIRKLVEAKANGPAVVDVLKREISGFDEIEPDGGKEARANATQPLYAAGNVFYPDPRLPGFEWVDSVVEQHLVFPRGKNDDDVDAANQALLDLYTGTSKLKAAMAAAKKAGLVQ